MQRNSEAGEPTNNLPTTAAGQPPQSLCGKRRLPEQLPQPSFIDWKPDPDAASLISPAVSGFTNPPPLLQTPTHSSPSSPAIPPPAPTPRLYQAPPPPSAPLPPRPTAPALYATRPGEQAVRVRIAIQVAAPSPADPRTGQATGTPVYASPIILTATTYVPQQ